MEQIQHWYLHVDLDAFFASVEQLDHPEYRGKPVIVGGKPEDRRSVVSTASYEARVYGIHSAMPTAQAYKLCPHGIYVHGRMERYVQLSFQIMEILKNYSPDVDQMSIDEAFLDITGTEKLFGKPEEVASKIKNQIKQETGLTVSIGLAQSKYHAKIASDINKPDGFYCVQPGTEEEFILNLPLKKVFGIGNKTLEKLNSCGIRTTRDIHEKTLESLQFMCGENQGTFLYNVVRGNFSDDRFGKTAKSHSISAETTFPYDVTDSYTLETVILNLAYSIMFRLLKEKGFSRTAMLKIRYEDFSTVSIQQTFDKNIATLDQFYEILKNLFHKKWELNRGVRLLGVGLENIDKEDKPAQQELFDDGTEKKQKVEKAILSMSQKHPELKVHKARMLQTIKNSFKGLIFIILFSSTPFFSKLNAEEMEEKPKEKFFTYEIEGYYEAGISGNILTTFGANTDFAISPSIPVFKQSVDLSADFSFGSNWNFYLNFADNFNKNTYTITYTGDNYLKEFKFSNRNIIFPQYYLSSQTEYNPGGGSNEAPGISFHWENKTASKYKADFILRYDMTSQNQATFYGKNKVTDITIEPENYIKGKYFVIPDSTIISDIQNIYIETDKSLSTNIQHQGIWFRKLDSSEYIISSEKKLLIINKNESATTENKQNKIIITFQDEETLDTLIASIGTYSDESTFLGKIQRYFSSTQNAIDLSKYTGALTTTIESKKALILQDSKYFSPFVISAGYTFGITENSEIFVINNISKQKNPLYGSSPILQDITQINEDLFTEKNQTILIYKKNFDTSDFTLPENRYPFADESPYIYLNAQNKTQLAILKRSYSSVSNFDIGKTAENNSIIVLINGIPTRNFNYSETSGFITINQSVSDSDRIDISWKSQAGTADNGTVVSAAGFTYNFNDSLTADVTLATKIPFNPFVKYGTYNSNHSSYTALTAGVNYSKDSLNIKNISSLSFETPNITNCYFVSTILTTGNQTYYHSQKCIFETKVVPQIIDITPSLKAENKGKSLITQGETDIKISGYKLPLKWEFSDSQNWTSFDIKLSQTDQLYNSNKIEIALKNESAYSLQDYRFFLQLGVIAGNDNQFKETNIPTWEITSLLDLSDDTINKWQTVLLSIPQEVQALLVEAKDARLIIYKNTSEITNGKLCVGPYELYNNGIYVNNSEKLAVTSTITQANNTPAAKKYISEKNFANTILWESSEFLFEEQDTFIKTQNYFSPAYFSDYKKINLDFMIQNEQTIPASISATNGLTLILDDFITEQIGLKFELSQNIMSNIISEDEKFHTLTIQTSTKEVFIDDIKLSPADYNLYINPTVAPVRQQLIINVQNSEKIITKGKFTCGNLYYTETNYSFNIKNAFTTDYVKEKVLSLKDDKQPLLYNAYIKVASNQNEVISFSENNNNYFNADLFLQSGISLLKTDFSAHLLFNFSSINPFSLENTGYSIKSNSPIYDFLNFSEDYVYNKQSKQTKKDDKLSMDFAKYKVPISFSFSTLAESSSLKTQQNYNSNFDFSIPIGKTNLVSKSNIKLSEKETVYNYETNFPSFGTNWISLLQKQFTSGDAFAEQRTELINTNLTYTITKNIIPQLSFKLESQTNNNQIQNNSNTSVFNISLPFKIKNNSFSISYSKKGINTKENTLYNNYSQDLSNLFRNQTEMYWYYTAIPFYELFDSSLNNKLLNTAGVSNSYNSKYEIKWKKPLSGSVKDLYIPIAASLAVTRDIVTSTNINDIYQLKADINYSFINLLGSKGKLKLFNFFSQDEYNSLISTLIKIPSSGTNITWKLTLAESLLFYIDNKNTIKTTSDFNISGSENWQLKFGGIWTHTGKDSVLASLPSIFIKSINDMSKDISRKETFTIAFGKNNNLFQQEYKYIHSCDVKLDEKITINNSLGAAFNHTQEKAASLNLEYSLGVKIQF